MKKCKQCEKELESFEYDGKSFKYDGKCMECSNKERIASGSCPKCGGKGGLTYACSWCGKRKSI